MSAAIAILIFKQSYGDGKASERCSSPDAYVLRDLVFDSFEPELLIGRGYIYFADFHDYGLLCFDANEVRSDNEYPVVYIDHENLEEVHSYASNFYDLLTGDSERGNRFIDYLNELHN